MQLKLMKMVDAPMVIDEKTEYVPAWIDVPLPDDIKTKAQARAYVRDHGEIGARYRVIDVKYEAECTDQRQVIYKRRTF